MTMLRKSSTNMQRPALLIAAALLLIVPCFAAAPFALRVAVQQPALTAAAVAPPQTKSAFDDFTGQHREGDVISGKILKMTNTRAVVELAPGVVTVMRIPQSAASSYELGAVRNFKIVRINPDEKIVNVVDPTAPPQELEHFVVATGRGDEPVTFMTSRVSPAQVSDQEAGARLKLEGAAVQGWKVEEPRTPEEKEKLIAQFKMRAAAERTELLQTAREAKITMEQAIQIAQSQQPGTVMESHLTRERGQATYIVVVVSGDDSNPTTTRFLISAVDGKVVDTFRGRNSNE